MSAENDAKLAKALQRAGWVEPPPAPVSPFDGLRNGLRGAGMAGNPIASMGAIFNKPGFGRGVMDPLPDNSVPGFAKPLRNALRAKPGDWRSAIADGLDTTMDVFRETGEAAMDAFSGWGECTFCAGGRRYCIWSADRRRPASRPCSAGFRILGLCATHAGA
jgi:hypothetical protein